MSVAVVSCLDLMHSKYRQNAVKSSWIFLQSSLKSESNDAADVSLSSTVFICWDIYGRVLLASSLSLQSSTIFEKMEGKKIKHLEYLESAVSRGNMVRIGLYSSIF